MKNAILNAIRCLALALFYAWITAAQTEFSTSVQVRDIFGATLHGATVFANNLKTGLQTASRSSKHGAFLVDLRDGRYRISAALPGFETSSVEIALPQDRDKVIVLRLAPAILSHSVVVSGSRETELAEDSVARVAMISRNQIVDSGYERVSDVLTEESGIVTRSGSSGTRSETQIQGIDSRQSLVLLDGYPVVGARGIKEGILNMDRQSTNRLDRIEVVKGASSALYGSDAIGGVIKLITRDPRERFDANFNASGGSLGTFSLRGDTGFLVNWWSGFLSSARHLLRQVADCGRAPRSGW